MHMAKTALAAVSLLLAAMGGESRAQAEWPTKPVRLIVPFAPGAGADIGARLVADGLAKKWGQGVVVENRPGGDSLIAIRAVVSENDPHTLLFTPSGNFTPHPYRHEKIGYDRARDLLPIARFSNTILGVGVSEASGIKSLSDLIARAKAKPGELNVVLVPGLTEMVWDGFARTMDLKFTKVPFANLGQGAAEMGTGRVDVMMSAVAIMQPVLQAKSARLIGVNGRERVQIFADTPTVAEAGAPSLQYEGLIGLFGPRAMSPELRRRVGEEVAEIARQRDIADKLVASGQTPNPGGSEEFAADIAEQEKQVAAIAQQLGLKRKD